MKTALIGMTYGLIMWGTNWIELYTHVDYKVDVITSIIFHLSVWIGLVFALIKDYKSS